MKATVVLKVSYKNLGYGYVKDFLNYVEQVDEDGVVFIGCH